jgi:HSP20 family protein
MTLIRRSTNPFDEIFAVRRAMDRLFDEDVFHPRTWRSVTVGAEPALDITTTPDELVVRASLPGWKPEDVEITLTGSTLTIAGEVAEETRREDESWILNEIRRASFSRTLELPEGLLGDGATATHENGILTLRIPKAEEVKPRQIRITATGETRPERELAGAGAAG